MAIDSNAAEQILDDYNFGNGVVRVGKSGWETETGSHEFRCKVFVEVEGEEGDSIALNFRVMFNQDGGILDVGALDDKGQEWGFYPC